MIMTNQEHIEKVLKKTFEIIKEVYEHQKETDGGAGTSTKQSRIIFPKKRDNSTRISEQELKLIFIEQLNKEIEIGWDVFYSVETPTQDTYCITGKTPQSGNFDLVIHDNTFKRIVLIEFKANNATTLGHQKDLDKLNNKNEQDENTLRYFIELLNNTDNGTLRSLHKKMEVNERSIFKCYSLQKGDITQEILSFQE